MCTLLLYLVHVTLSAVAYYSCTCIICITYILFSVYLTDIITVYAQHRIMVILHIAHLHVHFYHVTTIQQVILHIAHLHVHFYHVTTRQPSLLSKLDTTKDMTR